jgi:SAM-dependent methyltransferase
MFIDFKKIFPEEPEKLPWWLSYFYTTFAASSLRPTYEYIAGSIPLRNWGMLVDIGTGPGYLSELIAEQYPDLRVIGIDMSGTMVKLANKSRKKLPNLSFEIMDGKKTRFRNDSMDFIVSTFTFHQVKDQAGFLDEVHRLLKPGGYCYICEGYSGASDEDIEIALEYPWWQLKLSPDRIRELLAWHGFREDFEKYINPVIGRSHFRKAVSIKTDGIFLRIVLKKN